MSAGSLNQLRTANTARASTTVTPSRTRAAWPDLAAGASPPRPPTTWPGPTPSTINEGMRGRPSGECGRAAPGSPGTENYRCRPPARSWHRGRATPALPAPGPELAILRSTVCAVDRAGLESREADFLPTPKNTRKPSIFQGFRPSRRSAQTSRNVPKRALPVVHPTACSYPLLPDPSGRRPDRPRETRFPAPSVPSNGRSGSNPTGAAPV